MTDGMTYAASVMYETVRRMLYVAATEDKEEFCLNVKTASLYGVIPITQYIYIRRLVGRICPQ